MKTYDSKIENGLKSALFGLNDLMKDNLIVNNKLLAVTGELEQLVTMAQAGEIEHSINDPSIITEQHLEESRRLSQIE